MPTALYWCETWGPLSKIDYIRWEIWGPLSKIDYIRWYNHPIESLHAELIWNILNTHRAEQGRIRQISIGIKQAKKDPLNSGHT